MQSIGYQDTNHLSLVYLHGVNTRSTQQCVDNLEGVSRASGIHPWNRHGITNTCKTLYTTPKWNGKYTGYDVRFRCGIRIRPLLDVNVFLVKGSP